MKPDILRSAEGEVLENKGYRDAELLRLLQHYPRAQSVLNAASLVFGNGETLRFPTPTASQEEENKDPEIADRGFRARVARHTTATGASMFLLLHGLQEASAIQLPKRDLHRATEVMLLHDAFKVPEMRWRPLFNGSSDEAYVTAEDQLNMLLTRAGFTEKEAAYAGSIGLNGAKDFTLHPEEWPLERMCAFLADEINVETQIQTDLGAKTRRLMMQSRLPNSRYYDLNRTGFPDLTYDPRFVFPNGEPIPKFVLHRQATMQMAGKVGDALGIRGDQLGKYLIQQGVKYGVYDAKIV